MDSYHVEKQSMLKIILINEDSEIDPLPLEDHSRVSDNEMEPLSNIINDFNNQFGNIPRGDKDRVMWNIIKKIPNLVNNDPAYKNALHNSDKQNSRIEHDKALDREMAKLVNDDTELYKQYMDSATFKRWMTDIVFDLIYEERGSRPAGR